MKNRVLDKNLLAGLMFVAFGVAAVVIARDYNFGSARRMGPGYFPSVLGYLMAAMGGVIALRGFIAPKSPTRHWAWRALALVLAGVLVFAWALKPLGLMLATGALLLLAVVASRRPGLQEFIVLYGVLAIASYLIFITGLELVLDPWPSRS